MRNLFAALLTAGILIGCAAGPTKEQEGAAVEERGPSAAAPAPAPKQPGAEGAATKPLTSSQVGADPLTDPSNILSKRSVYFDFDSHVVKDQYKPIISAHAHYLAEHRAAQMRIEGNTDERGSREYNIALGQRRADAVKQVMQLLGAQAAQIETVSYGEEKPKAQGHEEADWAENRRVDIKYKDRGE